MDTTATPSSRASETAGTASTVGDQAKQTASVAVEGAANVAGTAKEQAGEVVGVARQQAQQMVTSAREELRTQSGEQMTRVAEGLRRIGEELRSMADAEPGGEDTPVRGIVREASGRVTTLADRIDTGGLDAAVGDITRYARRRPGVFLAGALAGGFLAGRALRLVQEAMSDETTSTGPSPTGSGPGMAGMPSGVVTPVPTNEVLAAGAPVGGPADPIVLGEASPAGSGIPAV